MYNRKYDILDKYRLSDEVDRKFEYETRNDRGPMNVELRHKISKEALDKKWVELRDKLNDIQKTNTCFHLNKMPNSTKLSHTSCFFWGISNDKICTSCELYNDKIKPIKDSMSELRVASEDFANAAKKEYRSK